MEADDLTKTCLILEQVCKFTAEVITSENGDIFLKGFNSEVCTLDLFNTKVPFAATIKPNFDYTLGIQYLNGCNVSATQPTGTLESNDYRFFCQIPQMEILNNDAISEADQNPWSGQ